MHDGIKIGISFYGGAALFDFSYELLEAPDRVVVDVNVLALCAGSHFIIRPVVPLVDGNQALRSAKYLRR